MITLFWCPKTRASRILWLLEELRQPFEVRLIDIRKPEAKKDPDFVAAFPVDVKVGDKILFGKYSGTTVKIDGEELLVMREEDIMAGVA